MAPLFRKHLFLEQRELIQLLVLLKDFQLLRFIVLAFKMSEKISAAEAYELAVEELFRLRDKRPLPDWTSGEAEAWVFDVHTQWSICNQNWGAAAEEHEWHDVEYSVLAELGSLPLRHVVYSREVYNILASRG
ncbi:hypothetical protein ARMGADRAFT_1093333, partial [Armillaria gallica]